jgi:hypothetical protein
VPHLKCEACRARVRRASAATDQLCPLCGAPLESVGSLSEIVGFRVVASTPPGGPSAAGHQRLADEVAKIVARRRAAEARSWSDVNRWAP